MDIILGLPVIHNSVRDYLPSDDHRIKKTPFLEHIYSIGVDPARWTVCNRFLSKKQPTRECGHVWNDSLKYCFQTETWSDINLRYIVLTDVYRQKDKEWVAMLNRIKKGETSPDVLNYLDKLNRPLKKDQTQGIIPTRLYTHRKEVERQNLKEFKKLKHQEYTFDAIDEGRFKTEDGFKVRDLTKDELNNHGKSPYPHTLSSQCLTNLSSFFFQPLRAQSCSPQTRCTSNVTFQHFSR